MAKNATAPTTSSDGRRLRGERTRLRVLDALLELVEEGEPRPTAHAVAARAGVALRTVYHHFEDVAAMRSMALTAQTERYREMLRPVSAGLSLEERIQTTAHQYRRLFEAITPLRRAALLDEDSPDVAEGFRAARAQRRAQLAETFGAELNERRGQGRALLDALDLIISWDSWNHLRANLGRSAVAAEKVLVLLLRDLFGATGASSEARTPQRPRQDEGRSRRSNGRQASGSRRAA